ncbi:MAG TPA: universal stress protein [Thermoplasmata archaeon]|nr:universal stress protein [Thermoplasmata archaeon]
MTGVELARIAVALDGSEYANHALEFAIDIARRYSSELQILSVAPLVPVYVAPAEPWIPAGIPESELAHYRKVVDEAVAKAEKAGLTKVTGLCLEGVIVDEILAHVEASPPDLLILGSRGLSTAKRLLLGSVSDAVAHHVGCPVLIVRPPRGKSTTSPRRS